MRLRIARIRILRKILIFNTPIFAFENIRYFPEIIAKPLDNCCILAVEVIYSDIRLFRIISQILKERLQASVVN